MRKKKHEDALASDTSAPKRKRRTLEERAVALRTRATVLEHGGIARDCIARVRVAMRAGDMRAAAEAARQLSEAIEAIEVLRVSF